MSGRGDSSGGRSLWDAVDGLVASKRVKIDRQGAPDPDVGAWLIHRGGVENACYVPSHTRAVATHRSASVVWATVPSLWDQSTAALFGGEAGTGRGSKPLRERSVADLNLIEIRAQISEGVRAGAEALGWAPKRDKSGKYPDFNAYAEIRHYASLVTEKAPDQTDLTAYRIASWTRALSTYLDTAEHQVRDVRLRNSPCPTCGTRQVTHTQDGEVLVLPALVIRFNNGLVQGAVCEACTDVWWRGEDMERLAHLLGVGLGDAQHGPEQLGA